MALYPPQIESTIPAFCKDKKFVIPFIMNKTVSWNDIQGFVIKIKNIQNNNLITTAEAIGENNYNKQRLEAYFEFDEDQLKKLSIGTSYKLQMAYKAKDGSYGHYSTVGVFKYTIEPTVEIEGLSDSQLHSDTREYIGVYSQKEKDPTEKVYSYNFTVYDERDSILETSGEQLHNHENDIDVYQSVDSFRMTRALEENKIYTIRYTVTTANGIIKSSPKYRITQQSTIPPEVEAKLVATMNEENGYVNLQLIGDKDEFGMEKVGTGTFLICRASSEDGYGTWSEVDRFALFGEKPSTHNWKDFTVQHGFTYIYSLQQYNQQYQIYSNRMLSNEIVANFEHSFLYDGKRQLKIKFNPQVSSFKETLLETKTNTMGGKYPFFFRNGNVRYKEFPISGLISYQSDEEELFLTNDELLLEDLDNLIREHTLKPEIRSDDYDYFNSMLDANSAYKIQLEYKKREREDSQENRISNKKDRTTNLTDYNIVAERMFKMKVLEFLNDGKPKLFRSPGEGNYIVRLMNSSLSPNDQLNRMIHTFSTTATEIDEFNYQKLNEYQLISTNEPDIKQLRWKTVDIRELVKQNASDEAYISIGGENNIKSIQCLDMVPGNTIQIKYATPDNDIRIIQIGTTGAYYTEFDEVVSQVLISSLNTQGQITYGYYETNLHHFDTYRYIKMDDIPVTQLHGPTGNKDIRKIFNLEDIKHRITKYYFLNFTKDYEWSQSLNNELQKLKKAYINKEEYYINKAGERVDIRTAEKYELEKERINSTYDITKFKFWIDGKEIDISETDNFQLIKPEHIPEIKLGAGICLDISIQRREIDYDVEEYDDKIIELKNEYQRLDNKLWNWIKFESENEENKIFEISDEDYEKIENYPKLDNKYNKKYIEELNNIKQSRNEKYQEFISVLESVLKEKEVLVK